MTNNFRFHVLFSLGYKLGLFVTQDTRLNEKRNVSGPSLDSHDHYQEHKQVYFLFLTQESFLRTTENITHMVLIMTEWIFVPEIVGVPLQSSSLKVYSTPAVLHSY